MDPWLYKLSPGYWLRSKTSKEMKDIEEKKWVQNADLMKQLKKQREDLDAAEKAAQAAQAVETAKAQAAATDAQLKEITASLKGGMSGSFVGHEQITPISQVVVNALDKTGNKEAAGKLYAKIKAGRALDSDELKAARKIANVIGRVRVVHGDLIDDRNEAVTMHGAFIGACMLGSVAKAIEQNARYQHLLAGLSNKIAADKPLAQPERNALAATLKGQKAMHGLVTSMVSGRAFIGCPQKKSWTKGAFIGTAKVMSDEDKKMLSAIVKLAKVGNPRAQKALVALKQSGEISGGDFIGFSLSKAFKYATAPVWLPAYGAYKGAKWVGKKTGIISKGGSSPEQQRLAMMAAAAKRRQASAARAAAADAQSEAEQRAQLAIADAADAEADAADAEALAKEQAMKTREVQADPSTLVRDEAEGDFIGKESKEAKLLAKYNEQSPTGIKLRAGTKLYMQAKTKTPEGRQARQAIKTMIKKAKAGDPQAKRDAYAVKAGQKVYRAQKKVQRKKAVLAIRDARKKRVIAVQKQFEARTANKLCRISRKRELKKHWKVERMAAAGHPKAKVYVAKQVTLAKQGNKKAQAHVAAMKQGRLIRQRVKTPREARNMRQAEKFARLLQRNDPSTLRQYEVLKAAANKGNPNAIRAIDRIMLAAMVVKTVNTGVVCMEPRKKKSRRAQIAQKGSTAHKRAQRQVALAKQKAATGTAKREELAAGAEAAHELGDNKTAALLANAASKAPSASNEINVKVQVINAAEKGHPEAKAELAKNLEDAKKGDVAGVKEMGKIMAADTVDKVNKGEPVSPTMTDAINLHERVKAKDPAAIAQAKEITEQATSSSPPPEATLAASGLVAASIVDQSLAHKPKARTEFMEKINPPVPPEEKTVAHAEVAAAVTKANEGTITAEEGQKAANLALRLGKPKVAAEIMAKSPPWDETPLSSLPDQPLSPITNLYELFVATLQAFTFTTRDPIANYRGGIANRGKIPPMSPPVASLGWSPFKIFATAKKVAPFTPFAAPIAAATAIHTAVTKKDAPAPAAESVAPAPASTAGRAEICGSDDFKDLIAKALKTKKMSKDDFNKAVKSNLPSNADEDTKKASTQQTLKFLQSKNVTVGGAFVGGAFVGASKTFKEHVVEAVKAKKMSKDDFNKAIDVHVGPQASKETKKAAGEKTLKFLLDKGVKVG
jgi:hypothetical protein